MKKRESPPDFRSPEVGISAVGKLSRGLVIGTMSKAKSCFVEPLNKMQVRDGQMGRNDQKAGNLLVKLTL